MVLAGSIGIGADASPVPSGLALDANALASLRAAADRDPQATVRQAATQFEALFLQELLKSMRAAVPKSGLFDGPAMDQVTGMLDSQLGRTMAGRAGGLADVIARQMSRQLGSAERSEGDPVGRTGEAGDAGGAVGGATGTGATGTGATGGTGASGALEPTDGMPPGLAAAARDLDPDGQGPGSALNPVQVAFVESMWPHAKAAERITGVPAAFVVGQAALESGWGRRDIRDADGNPSHNLFGIKATGGWQGRTVTTLTTEYVDGEPRRRVEPFRRYESYEEAFTDWARLMTRSNRYAAVLKADTAVEFARGLEAAGYATDPRYGDKLARTIRQAEQVAGRTQRIGVK